MSDIVRLESVSKWYGDVMGLNGVTIGFREGITGIVGPNGAGKTTMLNLIVGFLKPSKGRVQVFGEEPWSNPDVSRRIGYCPDTDALYEFMRGVDFVDLLTSFYGFSPDEARSRAVESLKRVGMGEMMERRIGSYSMGMRQRLKLAQALAHDPDLLVLDEPLKGLDPIGRMEMIETIKRLGDQGKTVLISSHVLYEIESMTERVVLINKGKVIAEGEIHEIRSLIDEHPHRVFIECDKPRPLARKLLDMDHIVRVDLEGDGVSIETESPDRFYSEFPRLVVETGVEVRRLYSPDDNLDSVFRYLIG